MTHPPKKASHHSRLSGWSDSCGSCGKWISEGDPIHLVLEHAEEKDPWQASYEWVCGECAE